MMADENAETIEQARKTNDWNREMEELAYKDRPTIKYHVYQVVDCTTGKEFTQIEESESGHCIRSDVIIDCADVQ